MHTHSPHSPQAYTEASARATAGGRGCQERDCLSPRPGWAASAGGTRAASWPSWSGFSFFSLCLVRPWLGTGVPGGTRGRGVAAWSLAWGGVAMVMVLALVAGRAGAVGVVRLAASSRAGAGTPRPEPFLLVSSLGGTYRPRGDSRAMPTSPAAPAQRNRMKPLSISDPSVVPVSLDPVGTPGSGTPSPTTPKDVLESSSSSPAGPFFPGTATGDWCQGSTGLSERSKGNPVCLGRQGQLLPLESWRSSPFLRMTSTVCGMGWRCEVMASLLIPL